MKKLKLTLGSISLLPFVGLAHAQISGSKLNDLFISPFTGGLDDFIAGLVTWIIGIAGLVAFFFLIYGGFLYLTAGGDSDKVSKGRTTITNAVIGLVIVAIAFAIAAFVIGTIGADSGTGNIDDQFTI